MSRPAKIERFLDRDSWIARMLASGLSSPAKVIVTRLALYLNIKREQLHVGADALAAETGYSERHVHRLIAEAKAAGWISVEPNIGGRGHANSYQLMLPVDIKGDTYDRDLNPDKINHDKINPDKNDPKPCQDGPQTLTYDVIQNSVTAEQREREHGTPVRALSRTVPVPKNQKEMAWAALRTVWKRPWADDQQVDRTAFEKACKEAAPEAIVAGAQAWVGAVDEARYLQPLAKWLAARSWEKPPPKRPKPKRGNGKVDVTKVMFKQAGWVEDEDGNLHDPETGVVWENLQ
jgi:hypothetical protein